MKRRAFIKSVIATSVASLAGVSGYQYYLQSQRDFNQSVETEFLNLDDQLVLSVFIPVIAAGVTQSVKISDSLTNIDQTILRLPRRTQAELRELLDILGSSFGRLVLAGVWLDWQQTATKKVDQFLTEWRQSLLALLQQAYIGLHQIIIGSVYAESRHWHAISYAKPY